MAQYIEDPSIARAIDDLKSRWPAVGDAADHPLTEWFIRRRGKIKRDTPIHLGRRRLKNLGRPFCLISDMGDVEQWVHFAVVALSYRDMAGVIAGYEYFKQVMPGRHYRLFLAVGTFILSISMLVFSGLIISQASEYSENSWRIGEWALVVSLVVLFSFSFWYLMSAPSLSMSLVLSLLKTSLKQNQGMTLMSLAPLLCNFLWIPIVSLMASFIVLPVAIYKGLLIYAVMYFSITSFLNIVMGFYYSAKDIDKIFLRIVDRESGKYSEYVSHIIDRK